MTRFCMLRVQDSKSELGNLTPAAASPNLQFTPFPFRHHSKSVGSRLIWDSWESLRIASGDQKDRSKCSRSHFGRYFHQGGHFYSHKCHSIGDRMSASTAKHWIMLMNNEED